MSTPTYKQVAPSFFVAHNHTGLFVRNDDKDEAKGYRSFDGGPGGHYASEYGYPLFMRDYERDLAALRAENERLRETEKGYCASVKCRDDDILTLRALLAEVELELARVKGNDERQFRILEDCKKQLLLSDQSHSLLPERIAVLQACLLSEKRAKIERGDMLVEAERERDEARAMLDKVQKSHFSLSKDLAAAREDACQLAAKFSESEHNVSCLGQAAHEAERTLKNCLAMSPLNPFERGEAINKTLLQLRVAIEIVGKENA